MKNAKIGLLSVMVLCILITATMRVSANICDVSVPVEILENPNLPDYTDGLSYPAPTALAEGAKYLDSVYTPWIESAQVRALNKANEECQKISTDCVVIEPKKVSNTINYKFLFRFYWTIFFGTVGSSIPMDMKIPDLYETADTDNTGAGNAAEIDVYQMPGLVKRSSTTGGLTFGAVEQYYVKNIDNFRYKATFKCESLNTYLP